MRKVIAVAMTTAALTVPVAGTAAADAGGTPNDNANTQTGNATPQGRKGHGCTVPGDAISEAAKADGSNHASGVANGQLVKLCTPAGS
jgi:hypothetical protein